MTGMLLEEEHPTPNTQHPTPNGASVCGARSAIGCWVLDVPKPPTRVHTFTHPTPGLAERWVSRQAGVPLFPMHPSSSSRFHSVIGAAALALTILSPSIRAAEPALQLK